jgi:prepilin-type N-terminal cleavage/methylation domain-containing protein
MVAKRTNLQLRAGRTQSGFTLLEVLISMVVMVTGLLAVLAVLGMAMASTSTSQQNAICKRLANEALESILTARETANIQFSQIANGTCLVGQNCGIFLTGAQPINLPGADGIIGTSDDAAAGPQILEMPGPSGVYMNNCPPDKCLPLTNYTRTIAIAPYTVGGVPVGTLNVVTITITYNNPQWKGLPQNYVLQTMISQYR